MAFAITSLLAIVAFLLPLRVRTEFQSTQVANLNFDFIQAFELEEAKTRALSEDPSSEESSVSISNNPFKSSQASSSDSKDSKPACSGKDCCKKCTGMVAMSIMKVVKEKVNKVCEKMPEEKDSMVLSRRQLSWGGAEEEGDVCDSLEGDEKKVGCKKMHYFCKWWKSDPYTAYGFLIIKVRPLSDGWFWCAGKGACNPHNVDEQKDNLYFTNDGKKELDTAYIEQEAALMPFVDPTFSKSGEVLGGDLELLMHASGAESAMKMMMKEGKESYYKDQEMMFKKKLEMSKKEGMMGEWGYGTDGEDEVDDYSDKKGKDGKHGHGKHHCSFWQKVKCGMKRMWNVIWPFGGGKHHHHDKYEEGESKSENEYINTKSDASVIEKPEEKKVYLPTVEPKTATKIEVVNARALSEIDNENTTYSKDSPMAYWFQEIQKDFSPSSYEYSRLNKSIPNPLISHICPACYKKVFHIVMHKSMMMVHKVCTTTKCPFIKGWCHWASIDGHRRIARGMIMGMVEPWKYAIGRCWKEGGGKGHKGKGKGSDDKGKGKGKGDDDDDDKGKGKGKHGHHKGHHKGKGKGKHHHHHHHPWGPWENDEEPNPAAVDNDMIVSKGYSEKGLGSDTDQLWLPASWIKTPEQPKLIDPIVSNKHHHQHHSHHHFSGMSKSVTYEKDKEGHMHQISKTTTYGGGPENSSKTVIEDKEMGVNGGTTSTVTTVTESKSSNNAPEAAAQTEIQAVPEQVAPVLPPMTMSTRPTIHIIPLTSASGSSSDVSTGSFIEDLVNMAHSGPRSLLASLFGEE